MKIYQNAWKAVDSLGNSTEQDFEKMVRTNLIPIYPVAPKDIINAHIIFGLDLSGIMG